MTNKMVVSYSEALLNSTAHQWMEANSDNEIVAVNFISDESPLLGNAAIVVGAKKVYCIEHALHSEAAGDFMATKLIAIALRENADTIVVAPQFVDMIKSKLDSSGDINIISPEDFN